MAFVGREAEREAFRIVADRLELRPGLVADDLPRGVVLADEFFGWWLAWPRWRRASSAAAWRILCRVYAPGWSGVQDGVRAACECSDL